MVFRLIPTNYLAPSGSWGKNSQKFAINYNTDQVVCKELIFWCSIIFDDKTIGNFNKNPKSHRDYQLDNKPQVFNKNEFHYLCSIIIIKKVTIE